jgi:hypothetical protein
MEMPDGQGSAEHQRRTRRANEQRAYALLGTKQASLSVTCECGQDQCAAELTVSRTAYRNVRRQPEWFLVQDGHQHADVQRVVHMHDDFLIVEV